MKIKHFAGYGSVNAKVIVKKKGYYEIEVRGNHEYGLVRYDEYDINKWLVKKVLRKDISYTDVKIIDIVNEWDSENHIDVAIYKLAINE